jgi:hypothetical protein
MCCCIVEVSFIRLLKARRSTSSKGLIGGTCQTYPSVVLLVLGIYFTDVYTEMSTEYV